MFCSYQSYNCHDIALKCIACHPQRSSILGRFVKEIGVHCQAYARTLSGFAISRDAAHNVMVVSHMNNMLSVYSLPGGEHIRTFGSYGSGTGQFDYPGKLCFTVAGNILVAVAIEGACVEAICGKQGCSGYQRITSDGSSAMCW